MRRLKIPSIVVPIMLSAACNTQSHKPSPPAKSAIAPQQAISGGDIIRTAATTDLHPIYVAMGGWNSCEPDPRIPNQDNPYGMNINKQFSKFVKLLEARYPDQPVKFMMSCHTPFISTVNWVTWKTPYTLEKGTHEQQYALIAKLARETNSPVVLFGSSYGGTYSMQATLTMPPDVNVIQLLTIDPISPTYCPAPTFANLIVSRVTDVLGMGGDSSSVGLGCQEAPRDFGPAQRQAIRARVQWWQNYHQTDMFSVLKSSKIDEACNQTISHQKLTNFVNGHIAMGMYESLWSDITDRLTNPIPTQCITQQL